MPYLFFSDPACTGFLDLVLARESIERTFGSAGHDLDIDTDPKIQDTNNIIHFSTGPISFESPCYEHFSAHGLV